MVQVKLRDEGGDPVVVKVVEFGDRTGYPVRNRVGVTPVMARKVRVKALWS